MGDERCCVYLGKCAGALSARAVFWGLPVDQILQVHKLSVNLGREDDCGSLLFR
jgi:hypothetical protein